MSNLIKQNSQKQKYPNKYTKPEETTAELAESRIITKNLVYIIGLSGKLANRELLLQKEYFAQYGSIVKIVVNKNKAYNTNSLKGPSYSAYVTYSKPYEASIAILSLDNVILDEHLIRASFGTTKYCVNFLKNIDCNNRECLFLHKTADDMDIIKRDDLNVNKNIFYQQHLYAIKIADVYNPEIKKKLTQNKAFKTVFPGTDAIYTKEIVKDNDPIYINNINNNWDNKNRRNYYDDMDNNINSNSKSKPKETNNNNKRRLNTLFSDSLNPSNNSNSNSNSNGFSKQANSDPIKQNNNEINIDTTSLNEKIITNFSDKIKKLDIKSKSIPEIFSAKEKSRFNFCETDHNTPDNSKSKIDLQSDDVCVEIPEFVKELIFKKVSRHNFTKFIKNIEDLLYEDKKLTSEYEKKDPWAHFIIENKYMDTELEFIDDFDSINRLILNKGKCHKI